MTFTRRRGLLLLLSLLALPACNESPTTIVSPSAAGAPVTLPATPTVPDVVEFRVVGFGVSQVSIRYGTSTDGMAQTVTSLPFYVATSSTRPTLFVSLDATTVLSMLPASAFLVGEIWINGSVFRSASASGSAPFSVTLSGTWRRSTAFDAGPELALAP